jgi:type II secretory pathway predicted ATPase ExeA
VAVAGGARPLFSEEAVARLHAASGGIPRVLNQLATQALLEGMARGTARVDGAVAEAVSREWDMDGVPAGARG